MPFGLGELLAVQRRRVLNVALLTTPYLGGSCSIVYEHSIAPPGDPVDGAQAYVTLLLAKNARSLLTIEKSHEFALGFLSWDDLALMVDVHDSYIDRQKFEVHNGLAYLPGANFTLFRRLETCGYFVANPYARVTGEIVDLHYREETASPLVEHLGHHSTLRGTTVQIK